jgi:hypothetical protein
MRFLSPQPLHSCRRARAAAICTVFLLASPSFAQQSAGGPFAGLPGSWSGAGTIALSSGAKERIRCAASYRLEGSLNLRLEMSCTSDSYRFELHSFITSSDQTISGSWNEVTRGVGGNVTGRADSGHIQARAEGQTFTAILDLTTRGSSQTVSIQSPGSEMAGVSIVLTRGSR